MPSVPQKKPKTQLKLHQEHANPTNVILKPYWPIKSLEKAITGRLPATRRSDQVSFKADNAGSRVCVCVVGVLDYVAVTPVARSDM